MVRRKNVLQALKRSDGGFIIVAVLWILIGLATLTSVYAVYVVNVAFAVGANDDQIQSEELTRAAVELAAYQLTRFAIADRPTSGETKFRMGGATVTVSFRTENARIDLNLAPKELLSNFFVGLGAGREQADDFAERIVGWRTKPQPGTADNEASLYRAAGKKYGPREGPFPHPDELWLVLGLPPNLVRRAEPYLTVYGLDPKINVVEAPPQVLAALPGMNPEELGNLLAMRGATQGSKDTLLQMLGPAQIMATVQGSKAVRLKIAVRFDNGRQTNSEIVITINDEPLQPYHILYWRDGFDQAASNVG